MWCRPTTWYTPVEKNKAFMFYRYVLTLSYFQAISPVIFSLKWTASCNLICHVCALPRERSETAPTRTLLGDNSTDLFLADANWSCDLEDASNGSQPRGHCYNMSCNVGWMYVAGAHCLVFTPVLKFHILGPGALCGYSLLRYVADKPFTVVHMTANWGSISGELCLLWCSSLSLLSGSWDTCELFPLLH